MAAREALRARATPRPVGRISRQSGLVQDGGAVIGNASPKRDPVRTAMIRAHACARAHVRRTRGNEVRRAIDDGVDVATPRGGSGWQPDAASFRDATERGVPAPRRGAMATSRLPRARASLMAARARAPHRHLHNAAAADARATRFFARRASVATPRC